MSKLRKAALAQQKESPYANVKPCLSFQWDGQQWRFNNGLIDFGEWSVTLAENAGFVIMPAQQAEPVAWMVYTLDGKSVCVTDNPADFTDSHRALPLYTAPPQRKPLTDEEIDKIIAEHVRITDQNLSGAVYMAMRDLEAAHGIGGSDA